MDQAKLIRKFPLVGFDKALNDEEHKAIAAEQLLREMDDPELRIRATSWVAGYKAGIGKAQALVNHALRAGD